MKTKSDMSNDTTTAADISYPTAEELDSGGHAENSGWRCDLYLVPASETDDGVPRVEMFSGVGNIGTPMPAFHRRWYHLGSYGPKAVGQSVFDALVAAEDALVAISAAYRGTRWDGHNNVGRWDADVWEEQYEDAIDLSSDNLRHYWDAADWFGPASVDWEELCREAGIDPERALTCDDLEALAEGVAAIVEPQQDERVSGTADYALRMAEQWVADQDEEED